IAVQRLLETLRWFVFFLILERMSTEALAIANIVYTCYIVFWIPTEGFSETACSMVSRFVGRNREYRIGGVLRNAIVGAILATVPFILLVLTLTMLCIAYVAAIHLAWLVELVWLSVPISWLVCLAISYGWVRSGLWKRLEV